MAVISMITEQWTRSILPPCPTYGIWGSRKTSWDGAANKKTYEREFSGVVRLTKIKTDRKIVEVRENLKNDKRTNWTWRDRDREERERRNWR